MSDMPSQEFKELSESIYNMVIEKTQDITAPEVHAIMSYIFLKYAQEWKVPPEVITTLLVSMAYKYKLLYENKYENS